MIDVLFREYRSILFKKGLRRVEVDCLCAVAQERINSEREYPRGVDVVDMIMDDTTRVAQRHRLPYAPPMPLKSRTGRLGRHDLFVKSLRDAYHSLTRVYAMEDAILANSRMYTIGQVAEIKSSRGRAERRYAGALTGYLRHTGQIQAWEASEIQKMFTKQKMKGQAQIHREYLLNMYPSELK